MLPTVDVKKVREAASELAAHMDGQYLNLSSMRRQLEHPEVLSLVEEMRWVVWKVQEFALAVKDALNDETPKETP